MARYFFTSAGLRRGWDAWRASWPKLILLDFDGTLSEFAPTPGQARLAPGMRPVLESLSRSPAAALAIISGRAAEDVKRRVNVPGIRYLGNHGASGFGAWPASPSRLRRAEKLARALRTVLKRYAGALLERKGPELSLHYRRVTANRIPGLLAEARAAAAGSGFALRGGNRVLEFRLPGAGGKGEAVKRLARILARGWRRTGLCLYLGDDATDEDAFAALRSLGLRTVSFKVGAGKTGATFRLRNVGEVRSLLQALAASRSSKPKKGA